MVSVFWVKDPKQVTLTLNIGCPLMLGLIPYALWRSSPRWVMPAASALYTVMLALSTAALITGVWFNGQELSSYDWQFSKARVKSSMPPRVMIVAPERPEAAPVPEPPPPPKEAEPAAKSSAEPAAKDTAEAAPKSSAEPAPKGSAEPAAKP